MKGTILKDYVLKIYRREKNDPRILAGVVEEVGVEGKKAFSSLDGLWEILHSPKADTAKAMKLNRPNKLNKPERYEKGNS